ncbi:ubiE/COQ5 methyltransferase [Drechslerella dactyloides]|uniref:Arsenite methyltransferase n=1 Tax=Drechslerella dactyloides TaxID=74499 RepID=A0AAD6J3W7_DREDA|nr:ubiE/COQ5 methyltransferase [Drechslerella dactyloides]
MDKDTIYQAVQDRYSAVTRIADQDTGTGTGSAYTQSVARAFGYTDEELVSIPREANMGLSCGNPTAMATLQEGETVIDLGSGAGLDVFLAANKVGLTGKVYGVDMNKASNTCSYLDMLLRAEQAKTRSGTTNVSFVESRITDIPLPAALANCIISNCVINLVPESEKQLVFDEMFRLLKPRGRVAISDILLKKPLSEALRSCMALYTGCISGASQIDDYRRYLHTAGFNGKYPPYGSLFGRRYDEGSTGDTLESRNTLSCCGGPAVSKAESIACCSAGDGGQQLQAGNKCYGDGGSGPELVLPDEFKGENLNNWAGSYKIFAIKA